MQRTQVQAPIQEDPTGQGAIKPVWHNNGVWEPQLLTVAPKSPSSTTREASASSSPCTSKKSHPCSLQLDKAHAAMKIQCRQKSINKLLKKIFSSFMSSYHIFSKIVQGSFPVQGEHFQTLYLCCALITIFY